MLVPCIAVIDEDNNDKSGNARDWQKFRTKYPYRPFCLLIPQHPAYPESSSRVGIPDELRTDSKFQAHNVTRDEGEMEADHWFKKCGLEKFGASNVDFVGLFVDESGSMTKSTVANSYNKFLQDLASANMKACEVNNTKEEWIDPFMIDLSPDSGPDSGKCVEAKPTMTEPATTTAPTTSPKGSSSCNQTDWLNINKYYIKDGISWDYELEQKAITLANEADGNNCELKPVDLGGGPHIFAISPDTTEASWSWVGSEKTNQSMCDMFQLWSKNSTWIYMQNLNFVGCGDNLEKASVDQNDCYTAVCIYTKLPSVPSCNDDKLCTEDKWNSTTNTCSNSPIVCPIGQTCDPSDG